MAYNLHGQWEDMVFCAAPLFDTAKNTKYHGYSVDDAVRSMAPKTVDPKKFNLGLSLSGVTFTLKDKTKNAPGSPAIGPGKQGCQEKGAMSYFEARKLSNAIQAASLKGEKGVQPDHFHREVTQQPKMDNVGKCMYMVVNEDQWVGYDTPETFDMKINYAKKVGFGGVSIWSMDSDSVNHELTQSIHESLNSGMIHKESTSTRGNVTNASIAIGAQRAHKGLDNQQPEKVKANTGCARQITGFAGKMMALLALSIVLLA
ncbi:glycosyl hydrolases family 18-domain-containing protein [Dissophora ornata]|nr:glycosyl hydrolases family 18-domain-containing protein [Dissophora ornata]